MSSYCPRCNKNVYPTMPHNCGDIAYSQGTTSTYPTCDRLQRENAELRKALELACAEVADHDCPHEYDLTERDECESCPRGREERYDAERDIKCWMRHFLEKAEGGGE